MFEVASGEFEGSFCFVIGFRFFLYIRCTFGLEIRVCGLIVVGFPISIDTRLSWVRKRCIVFLICSQFRSRFRVSASVNSNTYFRKLVSAILCKFLREIRVHKIFLQRIIPSSVSPR